MDFDAFTRLLTELAPLAVAKDDHEMKRAVSNMSSEWQKVFTTKGLIGLFPPDIQRQLLPRNAPIVLPPASIPEGRTADLASQVKLFRELLWLRAAELRDDLATRSSVVRLLKTAGDAIGKLYSFVKQNTSSDLQVTVIMSVLVLLALRVVVVALLFSMRRVLSIFYL